MYSNLKGEVVTVITAVGEVVGRLASVDEKCVKVTDPRLVAASPQGVGLAPSVGYSTEMEVNHCVFNLSNVITIVPTNDEIAKGWQQATSGIIL